MPQHSVYDTTNENFAIRIDVKKDLPKGDHLLAIKVNDVVGNTTYKTFEFSVD